MRLKSGVKLDGLTTQALFGMFVAEHVYMMYGSEVVITSANDGTHRPGSGHYKGTAVDIRTKNLHVTTQTKREITDTISVRLGHHYLVLLEDPGESNEHIHLEWLG